MGKDKRLFVVTFLAPALLLFTVFAAYPSARALSYSLQKWDGLSEPEWAGLSNFSKLLQDRELFLTALWHNVFLTLVGGSLIVCISLAFAALIHRRAPGAKLYRVAFFFPNVISSVAIALLWTLLYSTTDFGVINGALRVLDLGGSTIRPQDIRNPALLTASIQGETAHEGIRWPAADDRDGMSSDDAALAVYLNKAIQRRDLIDVTAFSWESLRGPAGQWLIEGANRLAAAPDRWDEFGSAGVGPVDTRSGPPREVWPGALAMLSEKENQRFNRRAIEQRFPDAIRPLWRPTESLFRAAGIDWLKINIPFPFTESRYLIRSLVPMMVWTAVGFYMVLFLAAMENIPESYYEAAILDGASAFAQFRHITLPLIREVLTVGIVFLVIGAMKFFDAIWVMENQWPRKESHVLATLLYQRVFTEYNVGEGAAIAVLLFAIIFLATLATLRLSRKEAIEY